MYKVRLISAASCPLRTLYKRLSVSAYSASRHFVSAKHGMSANGGFGMV